MQDGRFESGGELKVRLHNLKQNIESLCKRRKHLRGRLNALLAEAAQVENLLKRVEEKLPNAEALLVAYRSASRNRKN